MTIYAVNLPQEGALTTLLLVCAASTASSRFGGFSHPDEPLDDRGRRDAAASSLPVRFSNDIRSSPCRAAIGTSEAMGLKVSVEPVLRDVDYGRWAGRSFTDIENDQPGALRRWLDDPAQGSPGGETLDAVRARVGVWLGDLAGMRATICAISHPITIRAVLAHALDMPVSVALAIDVAPLSRTTLSFHGRWRLQSLEAP